MESITLEQHFYASAPIGLVEGRGWKTVAKSPGVGRHEDFEEHCAYYRPEDRKELLPVGWGWYPVAGDRICLHRMVYSGSDDLGRPGNFLAHDLILRKRDLEVIDYDIPTLFRFVSQHSPVRYPRHAGGDDGFARRHDQIYAQLGWDNNKLGNITPADRARLSKLAPLVVGLDEVRNLRLQADADFRSAWDPLRKASLVAPLLQAFLCAQEHRRPVLLFGVGDSDNNDDLTYKVVEFLFALLPHHCRRNLTFSTYAGDQDGDRAMTHHWKRQLVMTTRYNVVQLPTSASGAFPYWVIDVSNNKHLLPPASKLAQYFLEELATGKWDSLRQLRLLASHFDFEAETPGLDLAREMADWASTTLTRRQYEQFGKAAPFVRPGYPEFLKTANRFLDEVKQAGRLDRTLFEGLLRGYLRTVGTQYPGLSGRERASAEDRIIKGMGMAFELAFRNEVWDFLRDHLKMVSADPALTDVREPILARCFQSLETRLHQGLSLEDIDRFEELWGTLRECCRTGPGTGKQFLAQASEQFAVLLVKTDDKARSRLVPRLKFVQTVLQDAPFTSAAPLGDRLALLHDLDPEKPEVGAEFLTGLVQLDVLTPAAMARALADDPGMLLRFYPEWNLAAREPRIRAEIGPRLGLEALLEAFWLFPDDPPDESMHAGFVSALGQYKGPEWADDRRAAAKAYGARGAACLARVLGPGTQPWKLRELSRRIASHTELIDLMRQSAREGGKEAGGELQEVVRGFCGHLLDVLAMGLMRPLRAEYDPEVYAREILDRPLQILVSLYSTFPSRQKILREIGMRCARWRETVPSTDKTRFGALYQALLNVGLDKGEAHWQMMWCQRISRQPAGSTDHDAVRVEVNVEVLEKQPQLARAEEKPSELQTYLIGDSATWTGMAQAMLGSCLPGRDSAPLEELKRWFGKDRPHRVCVEVMEERGLLARAAPRLVDGLERWREVGGLVGLQDLVRLEAPESVLACVRPALKRRLTDQIRRWEQIYERAKQERTSLIPDDFDLAGTLRLGVEYLAEELTPRELAFYLECLAISACGWSPVTFRARAPELLHMLESVGKRLDRPLGEMWGTLFRQLARRSEGSKNFRACYIATGEGLFWHTYDPHVMIPGAQALAELRGNDLFHPLFWVSYRDDEKPSDGLKRDLGDKPENYSRFEEEEMARALMARARFAAVVYNHDSPGAELADIFLGLGSSASGGRILQSWLASTLMGYLTLEGNDPDILLARAKKLCQSRFWKPFHAEVSADTLIDTCEKLEKQLEALPVENAGKVVGRLRSRVGPLGWLWSMLPG